MKQENKSGFMSIVIHYMHLSYVLLKVYETPYLFDIKEEWVCFVSRTLKYTLDKFHRINKVSVLKVKLKMELKFVVNY